MPACELGVFLTLGYVTRGQLDFSQPQFHHLQDADDTTSCYCETETTA